jgi:hypothetical protein
LSVFRDLTRVWGSSGLWKFDYFIGKVPIKNQAAREEREKLLILAIHNYLL